jgi:hypothetical protein
MPERIGENAKKRVHQLAVGLLRAGRSLAVELGERVGEGWA